MFYTIVWSYDAWGGGPPNVMSGRFRTMHGPKNECQLLFDLLKKDDNPNLEHIELRCPEGQILSSWNRKQ
jgi:hypothetical protein